MFSPRTRYWVAGEGKWLIVKYNSTNMFCSTPAERGKVTAIMQIAEFPGVGSREEGVHLLVRESFSSLTHDLIDAIDATRRKVEANNKAMSDLLEQLKG